MGHLNARQVPRPSPRGSGWTPRLITWVILGVVCVLGVACGSAGPPSLRSLEAERLERLTSAPPEAASQPLVEKRHRIRWNPAPCECPPWEIFLDQEWLRVELKVSGDEAEAVVDAYEAEPASAAQEWSARGVVRASTAVSVGAGHSAVVAELSWIGEGEPPVVPVED